ncbi:MAG TPA: CHAT domain-containing tetratricopeptide repeat protein [Terriglobales bacterium]|nr:CHAT domain-containing tetratricopeptide repeat protein [Terriglobales bacterium]
MRIRALAIILFFLFLGLASLPACSRRRDPQSAYEHARETLRKGDMIAATSEAEKGYKDYKGAGAEWAWKFTILKARVLHSRGLDDEALRVLATGPAQPPSGESAVQELRWKGLAYTSLHRFAEAEQAFLEAERLCSSANYPVCADVIGAQGDLEMDRGHFSQAQSFFERVLPVARASGDQYWEASALLDLSWSADQQTHFDEALDWANRARQISVAQGYSDLSETALGNMGWAYYKLGDPEKAEENFVEARKSAERLGDATDQVRWITDAAYIDLDAGRFAIAEQSFQQSLNLARRVNNREGIIDSLIALAFVSEKTGKLGDAKRYTDEGLAKAREDNDAPDQVYLRLVQARVAARLHDATAAEAAFREVEQSPDCPVFLKWEAERSLARLYEDESQFDSAEKEYRTALTTFETARSGLQHVDSRLPFLSNASRIYDGYIHLLLTQNKTAEALQVADFNRARTLKEGLGMLPQGTSFAPEPLNAQQIAGHAGGTILFYWLGEEQSYLWAITPQKVGLFALPPAAEIKTRVERYRKAIIEQRESTPTASDDGAALYRILVEPAKDLLPKDISSKDAGNGKVFIVPDGILNSLNFETLLVPTSLGAEKQGETKDEPQQHYWIEDATISSAGSLRILQGANAAHRKDAGNLLLFGDAIAPNEDFPRLPKAAIEMESIEKHFATAEQQVFARDHASPPSYLASKPERFSYIHFVAHGTASRLSPLDSAIVLSRTLSKDSAGSGADEDSYKLYARDIIRYPLRAELVTISTCRSAGERAYSGEGLVGLSWAFVRAGAHHVIGALWDVSDTSTPQLMDELYGELKKGKPPDAALRNAKLNLLRSGASFRKPFFWAPFQLYAGS